MLYLVPNVLAVRVIYLTFVKTKEWTLGEIDGRRFEAERAISGEGGVKEP